MTSRGARASVFRSWLGRSLVFQLAVPTVQPISNRPDLFPSNGLGPGERVLFATRPSFLNGFWGRTLLLAALLFILLLPVATSGPGYLENPFSLFFIGVVIFFVYVVYAQWHHAIYAITNQRIVRISGWRGWGVESVPIGDVLSVNSGSSSGGAIMFRYRVPWTTGDANPSGFRVKTFNWPAVFNPVESGAWVQKSLGDAQAELVDKSGRGWAGESVAEVSVTCPHCGGRSAFSLIDPRRPTCPLCSAPLSLS